jgi:hypothetical protein
MYASGFSLLFPKHRWMADRGTSNQSLSAKLAALACAFGLDVPSFSGDLARLVSHSQRSFSRQRARGGV